MARAPDDGQSTVEFALLLPVLVLALAVVVQLGVVAYEQILVVNAAREGAREAAVNADRGDVERAVRAAGPLAADRLSITMGERGAPGSRVTVGVRYRMAVRVPLLHRIFGDGVLQSSATMRVER